MKGSFLLHHTSSYQGFPSKDFKDDKDLFCQGFQGFIWIIFKSSGWIILLGLIGFDGIPHPFLPLTSYFLLLTSYIIHLPSPPSLSEGAGGRLHPKSTHCGGCRGGHDQSHG